MQEKGIRKSNFKDPVHLLLLIVKAWTVFRLPTEVNGEEFEDWTSNMDITEFPDVQQDLSNESYIPYELRPETYIVPVIFLVIFIVGFVGNGVLIIILLRNKSMRTVPNIYIFSLAVGDFIVIVGSVPFISTIYTFESWPYGIEVCKFSEFLKDLSSGVTVFTLTLLSIDRYYAIVEPFHKFTGMPAKKLTLILSLATWAASTAISAPGAYYSYLMEIKIHSNESVYICYPFPTPMEPWYPKAMVMTKFLILYAIPLAIIAYFYCRIARHLVRTSDNFFGIMHTHPRSASSRVRVAKVVLAFVLAFAVCFFPNHVFMLWFYFNPNSHEDYSYFWHVWKISGYVMTFINSCLNPIALYLISSQFRSEYRRCFRCGSLPDGNGADVTLRTVPNTSTKSTCPTRAGSRV